MVIQYPFFICRTSQNKTQSIHLFNVLVAVDRVQIPVPTGTSERDLYHLRNLCHQLRNKPSWRKSWFLLLLHLWSRTFPSFPNCWTKSIPNIFHMSTVIKQELKQCRWVQKFNKTQTLIIKSTELWFKWNKTKIKPKLKQKPSIILSCFK